MEATVLELAKSSFERAPWGWGVLVLFASTLLKTWPVIQLQVMDAKAKLRAEKRTDLGDCQKRLDQMEIRLDAAEKQSYHFERKLMAALTAYSILDVELSVTNPDSVSLRQSRAVLQQFMDAEQKATQPEAPADPPPA